MNCTQCSGIKIDQSKQMCELCRKIRREKAKLSYWDKKQKGLCPFCGISTDRYKLQCLSCLKKKKYLNIDSAVRIISVWGDEIDWKF